LAQVQYGFAVSLTGILSREVVDAEADGAQGQTRSIGRPGDRRLSQIEFDVVEGDEGGEVCLLEAVDERTSAGARAAWAVSIVRSEASQSGLRVPLRDPGVGSPAPISAGRIARAGRRRKIQRPPALVLPVVSAEAGSILPPPQPGDGNLKGGRIRAPWSRWIES
jgi:hypothetical protein